MSAHISRNSPAAAKPEITATVLKNSIRLRLHVINTFFFTLINSLFSNSSNSSGCGIKKSKYTHSSSTFGATELFHLPGQLLCVFFRSYRKCVMLKFLKRGNTFLGLLILHFTLLLRCHWFAVVNNLVGRRV